MNRRQFITRVGGGLLGTPLLPLFRHSEMRADVVVVGGGVGGTAAALAAARNGLRVVMTEETDWIGGQLTQQAVPPDEHPWIEQFGANRSYRRFRQSVRDYYRRNYPLSESAYSAEYLNPGTCMVSRLCHEPRIALAVLEEMLAQYVSGGRLTILREHVPVSASVSGDRVESVRVRDQLSGRDIDLSAPYVLDATELGDLLPMTATEHVTGAESHRETGELHAPAQADPLNMQAITWCFAMDYVEAEDHTIEKPAEYDFWRSYVPELAPSWPGKLLSLTYSHPITLEPRTLPFDPRNEVPYGGWWDYRRLADPENFREGSYPGGITLVNWPQNDYLLSPIIDVPDAAHHLERAKQLSYALFYWLQTEAPRPDGGAGWPGLRLRGDLTGTDHGLAKRPYIRESRRIRAEFTVLEQHVGLEARIAETGLSAEEVTAASFPDSVGVGSYRIDLHPSTGGDNYIDISSLPFEIPLGALIPQRMENVIPGCKNLGVTHITNGCYRLHPVEWAIGEAAGLLASFALQKGEPPRQIRNKLLPDFQRFLQANGVEYRWPDLTPR